MMSGFGFEIDQGCIVVESAEFWRTSDHAMLFVCDLKAKYAEVIHGVSGGGVDVLLTKGPETLYAEEGDKATRIRITGASVRDEWFIEANVGRYTLVVMAVKADPTVQR